MRKQIGLGVLFVSLLGSAPAMAQYPTIPPELEAKEEAAAKEAKQKSEEAWKKAYLIVEQDHKKGKIYVPNASKPSDLLKASIPAFPGAEGGGAYTMGGRGGKVYVVTNLNDSGAGSFREACEQGGARIIVFNVAGIIRLSSPISIRAPYVTIAGQTAPGDGICIAGESVLIDTHDVIIRYMRFRRGETKVTRRDDAIGGNVVGNIMIDHVSASWGLDENMSMYRHVYDRESGSPLKLPTVNITIQNSIFSECLDTYNHAFGSTIGGLNSTFMRNLWANNVARNPSIGMYGDFGFVNNVVFNWWNRSADGGDNKSFFNFINNYYKPGPITPENQPIRYRILKPESGRSPESKSLYGKVYANGNIMEGNERVTKDNWDGGIQIESLPNAGNQTDSMRVNQPFPMAKVTQVSAKEAYDYVLNNVGANLPKRDPVDKRVIEEVRTGKIVYSPDAQAPTGGQYIKRRLPADSYKQGIISDISQVGGYPTYTGKPYKDTDNDGMPDAWETQKGLNPKDATDASADRDKDGYTNIEEYLNSVVPLNGVVPSGK